MYAVKGRSIRSTRGGRRTFASKSQPNKLSLSKIYVERGGGYL